MTDTRRSLASAAAALCLASACASPTPTPQAAAGVPTTSAATPAAETSRAQPLVYDGGDDGKDIRVSARTTAPAASLQDDTENALQHDAESVEPPTHEREPASTTTPPAASEAAGRSVPPATPDRKRLSMRGGVGCWIVSASAVRCWDSVSEWEQPGDFIDVSAGSLFSCGVTNAHRVRCWSKEHGEGKYQTWHDSTDEIPIPSASDISFVEVDGPHLCVMHIDGSLGCHGREFWGALPAVEGVTVPAPGSLPDGPFSSFSTGAWEDDASAGLSCAVRSDSGELACWGYGGTERAPAGQYSQVSVSLGLLPGELNVGGIIIAYGSGTMICGLQLDGRIACWSESASQPDGNEFAAHYAPAGSYRQVSAGYEHVCALRADGRVQCWNISEPLPPGADASTSTAPAVLQSADTQFAEIAVGHADHACGLTVSGALECWHIRAPEQPVNLPEDSGSGPEVSNIEVRTDESGNILLSGTGPGDVTVNLDEGVYRARILRYHALVLTVEPSDLPSSPDFEPQICHQSVYESLGAISPQELYRLSLGGITRPYGEFDIRDERLVPSADDGIYGTVGEVVVASSEFAIGDIIHADCMPGSFDITIDTSDQRQWHIVLHRTEIGGPTAWNAARLSRGDHGFTQIDAATNLDPYRPWSSRPYLCGLLAGGATVCWDSYGDLLAAPPENEYTSISASAWLGCSLDVDGIIHCWNPYGHNAAADDAHAKYVDVGLLACRIDDNGELKCGEDGAFDDDIGSAPCKIYDDESMSCYAQSEWPYDDDYRDAPCRVDITGADVCKEGQHPTWWDEIALLEKAAYDKVFSAEFNRVVCAFTDDAYLRCGGSGLPADLRNPQPGYRTVSVGAVTICAVNVNASIECWRSRWAPGHYWPPPQGNDWADVAVGLFHACALRDDGTVECWGWNRYGQASPPSGTFKQITSTEYMSCGLRPQGSVECWGRADQRS